MKRPGPDAAAVARTVDRVLDALDWHALGEIYFHWGGQDFWRERLPQVGELGARLARALLPRVPRRGSSLWVGAGVAELPVLFAEALLHERTVVAANLRERECELLNAGIAAVAADVPVRFTPGDARTVAAGRTFDHVGCISVFTDPETWPQLSGVAYGRLPPVQVDVERFVAEREAARGLAQELFAHVARPGLVTTTAEEVAWFLEQADRAGVVVEPGDELIDTAVVGDAVGFLALAATA